MYCVLIVYKTINACNESNSREGEGVVNSLANGLRLSSESETAEQDDPNPKA